MKESLMAMIGVGRRVTFVRYQRGELWYRTDDGFEFPVPIGDTGDGAFLAEDKALMFMRWIRQHLTFLESARGEQADDDDQQHSER